MKSKTPTATKVSIRRSQWDRLAEAALAARGQAYAPYSKFAVGAALLGDGDEPRIITGGNVENASFGLTICAERAAVASAIASGHRRFIAIAVATAGPEPAPPCGPCLQVLAEFCDDDLEILLLNDEGVRVKTRLCRLLPRPFRMRS